MKLLILNPQVIILVLSFHILLKSHKEAECTFLSSLHNCSRGSHSRFCFTMWGGVYLVLFWISGSDLAEALPSLSNILYKGRVILKRCGAPIMSNINNQLASKSSLIILDLKQLAAAPTHELMLCMRFHLKLLLFETFDCIS